VPTAAATTAAPDTGVPSTDLAVPSTEGGSPLPAASAKGEPGRSAEDIRVRVQANRDAARACYDAGQKRIASLEGDVVVKWLIDPKGQVRDVEVDEARSTIKDAVTTQCILDVIRKLQFPESAKGFETRASYPFNFRPKNSTKP
jgi:TonB family protein